MIAPLMYGMSGNMAAGVLSGQNAGSFLSGAESLAWVVSVRAMPVPVYHYGVPVRTVYWYSAHRPFNPSREKKGNKKIVYGCSAPTHTRPGRSKCPGPPVRSADSSAGPGQRTSCPLRRLRHARARHVSAAALAALAAPLVTQTSRSCISIEGHEIS